MTNDCLVTNLKGTVNSDLPFFGYSRIYMNIPESASITNDTYITASFSVSSKMKIVGDGNFTEGPGGTSLGKEITVLPGALRTIFVSPGTYKVLYDKYNPLSVPMVIGLAYDGIEVDVNMLPDSMERIEIIKPTESIVVDETWHRFTEVTQVTLQGYNTKSITGDVMDFANSLKLSSFFINGSRLSGNLSSLFDAWQAGNKIGNVEVAVHPDAVTIPTGGSWHMRVTFAGSETPWTFTNL